MGTSRLILAWLLILTVGFLAGPWAEVSAQNPYVPPGGAPLFRAGGAAWGGGVGMNPYMNTGFFNPYGNVNPYVLNNTLGAAAAMSSAASLPGYGASIGSSPYGGGNPYGGGFPYYPTFMDPNYGYLSGAGQVINAQSTFMKSVQESNILKEQVKREKIENRRRVFEEWLYERERMPTAQDNRERNQKLEYRRAIDPPITELYSAKSLNDLMDHLKKLPANSLPAGAAFPLDEELLGKVNVTPGLIGSKGNSGLLRNNGKISWPLVLRGDDFKNDVDKLDELLPDAVKQATSKGEVGRNTVNDIIACVNKMQKHLASSIKDLPPAQHIEAKRFLNNLDDAVKVLGQPDVGNYFNRTYIAKGQNVQELIKYMMEKGLKFAPAVSGDEAAYNALHQALVAFDMASQNQLAEQRTPPPAPNK